MLRGDGSHRASLCGRASVCVSLCLVSEGSRFGAPWGPELGACVPSSKVDRMDTTGPATSDRYNWRIDASEQSHLSGG